MARDCSDIVGVFQEFESVLDKKHPFSNETLDELAKTGAWLTQKLSPKAANPKPKSTRTAESILRDRFWTLVEERHDRLRTIGVMLFGIKNVDEHVPPLLSRVPNRKTPAETAPPAEPSSPH
jgi:hypothetical protein